MDIALKRIAENKRIRNSYLDLSGCGISFLPEEILQLAWLETLNLSANQIRDLSVLHGLTELTSLDLSRNQITDLPALKIPTDLTSLNLYNNQITDPSALKNLTGLTSLNLGHNRIEDPSALESLTGLNSLSLYSNQIGDLSRLQSLVGLTSLGLARNHIRDISPLQSLSGLTSLSLYSNQIENIFDLKDLTGLIFLKLSNNQIRDIFALKKLTKLTSLNLNHNQISDLSALQSLTQLTSIHLSNNQIDNISALKKLTRLTFLDLNYNQISNTSALKKLTRLTSLNLNHNQINDISGLGSLTGLIALKLINNQIGDISALQSLTELASLDLSYNQIADISALQKLTELDGLSLYSNQISDISALQSLIRLISLDLSHNQICNVSALRNLDRLTSLNLSHNQISDISALQSLTKLTDLYIRGNQLSSIPQAVAIITLPILKSLDLSGNQFEEIPKELLDNTDNASLRNLRSYFKDVDQSKGIPNKELKIVLIGNGGVGKTCLYKRLVHNTFDPAEKSTHAIEIDEWTLAVDPHLDAELTELTMNIWDFGGQYIYHATHRLFMQTEALFLLVWDADAEQRKFTPENTPDGDTINYPNYPLHYWLSYAKTLGRNSPVIIVQTKIKLLGHYQRLPPNSNALEKKFSNILGFEYVDSRTSSGFVRLKVAVQEAVLNLFSRSRVLIPKSWHSVRTAIKETAQSSRHMGLEEYRKLCQKHGLESTSPDTLLAYLHDIGLVFHKRGLFNDLIILDQKWAIDAVYTLFDRKKMFYKLVKRGLNGKFTLDDLEEVWHEYSLAEKQLFISFMKSCEICYEVTDERNHQLSPEQREYLAPSLLSEQKPLSITSI